MLIYKKSVRDWLAWICWVCFYFQFSNPPFSSFEVSLLHLFQVNVNYIIRQKNRIKIIFFHSKQSAFRLFHSLLLFRLHKFSKHPVYPQIPFYVFYTHFQLQPPTRLFESPILFGTQECAFEFSICFSSSCVLHLNKESGKLTGVHL